ncbi:T9SS type A sorting domain-containing protein [Bacteroidota bacterium]
MKVIFFIILFGYTVLAQSEFLVNTYQDSTQREPRISIDAIGNYVIVWQSENQVNQNSKGDIYYQLFNSNDERVGTETLVNTYTENEQERPAVAMNSSGDFVIVWASHTGDSDSIFEIKAKVFYNNSETSRELLVNTNVLNSQTKPDVAFNDESEFIVVWESWFQDGSNKGVYAQRFDMDGNKMGSEFRVNSNTVFSQGRPIVEYFSVGGFIVIWESWKQEIITPSGYGLFGKIFDSDGNVVLDEFQINTYTNDYQWFGDIETYDDGSFIIVWCSWEQDGFDGGIYLGKFNGDGEKIGAEIPVNRTTVNYQWLPKIKKMPGGNAAVVWSSWRQDGSREGVYAQLFDADLNKISFETRVNDYTDSFQWEPDFIATDDNELLVTWASWGQFDNEYDIIAKRISPQGAQGVINTKTYEHTQGSSTSRVFVHVADSTILTGDQYQVTFDVQENSAVTDIINLSSGSEVVTDFPLNSGEGVFYLSPEFDGVVVEFVPIFDFKLDTDNSYFVNNSGSNLLFTVGGGLGSSVLAPIDMTVIWGNTDTLSDGSYMNALDSAYNTSGQKVVKCPFYAWNVTDGEKMDLVIIEPSQSENLKWDPKEQVGFLTPSKYTTAFPRYHASLNTDYTGENLILPNFGDTNYIFTKRPLSSDDVFEFQTLKSFITTDVKENLSKPGKFSLSQNYPNPFNPTTTIVYSIPQEGLVDLRVYNILGESVQTLVKAIQKSGNYKVVFNSKGFASGVYIYVLKTQNRVISRKMLLIR